MRLDPKAFTRERTLPLPVLASMLLNLRAGTLQNKLDQHANLLSVRDQLRNIAASAFCQARRKLAPMAVRALREQAVMYFCKRFPAKRWHGLRLLRVDGSTLHFRRPRRMSSPSSVPQPSGSTVPLAWQARVYDVLNQVVVDADLVGTSVGHRVLAGRISPLPMRRICCSTTAVTRRPGCLRCISSSGVPSACGCFWGSPRRSRHTSPPGIPSAAVTFTSCGETRRQCESYGLPSTPLQLRLVLKGSPIVYIRPAAAPTASTSPTPFRNLESLAIEAIDMSAVRADEYA